MELYNWKYPNVKTKRTYYTDEKISNCKKNVKKYNWAKKVVDDTICHAETYLNYGIENIYTYMTPQVIPRSYMVNQERGCPICGKDIERCGRFPWLADTMNKPFKIECPNCHNVFPSNDFDSYYKSGLDESGIFIREKADPKYLVNQLYPDKPDDWCVDDGYGWHNPEYSTDNNYTFIACYNHWFLWYNLGWAGMPLITRAISIFKDAYLYTGDKKYAYAGLVILNRMADLYPDMDSSIFKWEDGFKNSHGLRGRGKIVGCIWETVLIKEYLMAYDALFPAIDEEALKIVLSMPGYQNSDYHVKTVDDIKRNIENNIVHEVYPGVMEGTITGNVGMSQSSLALAAVVIDYDEYADKWIEQIYDGRNEISWKRQGLTQILINNTDHDGIGDESSPEYNSLWVSCLAQVADILYGYKNEKYDLYKNPRFIKMFNLYPSLFVIGAYTPPIGDTKCAGDPGITFKGPCVVSFFEKTKDVQAAKLLHYMSKIRREKGENPAICTEIFVDCEKIEEDVLKIVKQYGEMKSTSKNLTGYGFASLASINQNDEKALSIYYGRNNGHGHRDSLNLYLHGFGVDLLPDHGYPGYADRNFERSHWTVNSIAHNLVVVDDEAQKDSFVSQPLHFDGDNSVKVMDIAAPLAYPQTKMYRRTSVSINIEENFYVFDAFRVEGGNEHLFSFHAAEGQAETFGVQLTPQKEGTLAGEDIKYAQESYDRNCWNGRDYLVNVEKDNKPSGYFGADWKVEDTWKVWENPRDVHVKLTMLTECDEIAFCDGAPPQNKPGNPKSYRYLLATRKGRDIKSQFVSIIDAYENKSEIHSIERLPVITKDNKHEDFSASCVKITMKNGRQDYILNSTDNETYIVETEQSKITFNGFLAVCSFKNGSLIYSYTNDVKTFKIGTKNYGQEIPSIKGKVVSFTEKPEFENKIIVKLDNKSEKKIQGNEAQMDLNSLKGNFIYVDNDTLRNGAYEIKSLVKNPDNTVIINTGDVGYIRSFKDNENQEKGYVYNIKKGANFTIPLAKEIF